MVIEPSSPITEPCPALNNGSSSSISTANVTASKQSISPLSNLVPTTVVKLASCNQFYQGQVEFYPTMAHRRQRRHG